MVRAKLVHPVELYVPTLSFFNFLRRVYFLIVAGDCDDAGKIKEAEIETDESNEIKTKKNKMCALCGATSFPLSPFQAPASLDRGSCIVRHSFASDSFSTHILSC